VAIGRAAAQLVRDGETLLMDVGTTTAAAARALTTRTELKNVTVFTNGLKTALELEPAFPRITAVPLGGSRSDRVPAGLARGRCDVCGRGLQ
jgi:DeoR family transcriptional regulator of aga operon